MTMQSTSSSHSSVNPAPPPDDSLFWSNDLRANFQLYSETLLRHVVGKMLRPRSHWPIEELIDRVVETVSNPPLIDRRLRELPVGCRRLLALIELSGQPRWHVGNLIEMVTALGEEDGLSIVKTLLETGLLYPDLQAAATPTSEHSEYARPACTSFEDWLSHTPAVHLKVCAHPDITRRAAKEDLGLPDLSAEGNDHAPAALSPREGDGLEWILRLAILWQQSLFAPFRLTQQGDFYKRDLERLQKDPLLASAPVETLADIPDIGSLTAALALAQGILVEENGDLKAGELPAVWDDGLPAAIKSLWMALMRVDRWNAIDGSAGTGDIGNPYPGAYLLCLLLLARLPDERWCRAEAVAQWVLAHHPYWRRGKAQANGQVSSAVQEGLQRFLLGVAFHLRLIQAAKTSDDAWMIRLSKIGRWLFGRGELPPLAGFPQTLLVQPNLEILLYRQGATPELITRLGRIAAWKGLGAACNLQLEPETVYAALERGETFEGILHLFQQHGMKPTPGPVIDSLRTWAQKRDRITVYPSAIVLEFLTAEDLDDAVARGTPAMRIGDRLAIVGKESDLHLQHFRLRGNRDYTLPPEPCVTLKEDGITLEVDVGKSDLLLESELRRFADEVETGSPGVHTFRLTPASIQRGSECGLTEETLDRWFLIRCNQPLSPAARLLLTGHATDPLQLRHLTVVQVASEEIADGLMQWPETRIHIAERLGPTAIVVVEEQLPQLLEKIQSLGMKLTK